MSCYDEFCNRYNVKQLRKRRSALGLSFLPGLFNGRVDSTILHEKFALRVPARQTCADLFSLTNARNYLFMSLLSNCNLMPFTGPGYWFWKENYLFIL